MVNGISGQNQNYSAFYRAAVGNAIVNQNDVKNMVNFLNGQPVTVIPEPTISEVALQSLPFAAAIGGIQAFNIWKNNGLSGQELEDFQNARKAGTAKGYNIKETIKNVKAAHPYTQRSEALKSGLDNLKKEYGDILKKHVTPNEARAPFKIGKALDYIPGYKKLRTTGFGQVMGKSGAGWMTALDGGVKLFSEVIPTFQELGFSAGMKQVAKTGTQVIAGGAGWLAGDAIGTVIGTALGTAICPGVGTAVGGFLGRFICGMVGSAVAAKAAKAVTGKNELEKVQEQKMSEITQQIDSNPETKLALAQQALAAAEQILAQEPKNKDALAAKASAEKVIAEYKSSDSRQAQTQMNTQPAPSQLAYAPLFEGIPVVPGFNGVDYDLNIYNQAMSNVSLPAANQSLFFNPAFATQTTSNLFGQPALTQQQTTQQTTQQIAK